MGSLHWLISVIQRFPVAVMAVMLFVSCSKDASTSAQPLSVNFRMTVPVNLSATGGPEYDGNSTWGEGYNREDALSAENRILWDDFSVTFFSENDKSYIGHLSDIHCVNLLPGVNVATYECEGVLTTTGRMEVEDLVEKLRSSGKVRTLVMANVKTDSESLKAGISQPDAGPGALKYSCGGSFNLEFPAIPMFGITTNDFSGLTPGGSMDLGKIALLRSVAKVEVLISEELNRESNSTIRLNSVTVSRMNTEGYVLPGKWSEIGKIEDLKLSESVRIPDNVSQKSQCLFKVGTDGAVVFYLPECRNTQGESEIIMTVSYNVEDEERTGTVHLCEYQNGFPTENLWDVVRNHLYRYIITNTGEIKFKVEVHPWDEVEIPEIMM